MEGAFDPTDTIGSSAPAESLSSQPAGSPSAVLGPPRVFMPLKPVAVGAVGFDFPATLHGSTEHFRVYIDPSLGAEGGALADGVIARCEHDYQVIAGYFGAQAGPFNVIVARLPTGGAYHYGCGATDFYCDAGPLPSDGRFPEFLNVAEFVEVFAQLQNGGWDCGQNNGEGLSRVLSAGLYPDLLGEFASAHYWLDAPGRPDFVSQNDPTDRNPIANGCAVLFLNYLNAQLGYSWNQIVQAAGPTLAQTYERLTGLTDGFARFSAVLAEHFPPGSPSQLTTDNPFPLKRPSAEWSQWESLGGLLISAPGVASWGPNRLDAFAVGSDHTLLHRGWDGSQWGGWEGLGGLLVSRPRVLSRQFNRIDVFGVGVNFAVWHRWWDGSAWQGFGSLGGWAGSGLDAVAWGPDRVDLFAVGSDSALWHTWWMGSSWAPWESLGGVLLGEVSAVTWGHNRLDVFGVGPDHALWHTFWDGVQWGTWETLGGVLTTPPRAVSWGPNRLDVFALGQDHVLGHQSWDGTRWQGWEGLGGTLVGTPEVVSRAPGLIDLLAVGPDSALWHRSFDGSQWQPWASLGGSCFSAVAGAAWSADRLDVFTVGGDSTLQHLWWV